MSRAETERLYRTLVKWLPPCMGVVFSGDSWHWRILDASLSTKWRIHCVHPFKAPVTITFPMHERRTKSVVGLEHECVRQVAEMVGCTEEDVRCVARGER